MADKISVEIDLEGGAEVEKQLADIGKSGQQAFSDIQSAADQINLGSATEQFDELGSAGQAAFQKVQVAAKNAVAFEQVIQGIGKVEGAFESLGAAATKMATRMTRSLGVFGVLARSLGPIGIAAGVAAGAFIKFGNDAANALSGLTTEAAKLDLTAQQFDRLQKALEQTGISSDAIGPGLQKLKETLAGELFPPDTITGFQRIVAELERMPDGVQRTQLAIQKLGDALGGQVIAGLQTGALTAESFAAALGKVSPATQEQIIQAKKYEQALNQLNAAWTELKTAFEPITTPIFQFLTAQLQQFKKDLQELRLEIAFAKALWDVFKAGVTGQDMGEAARKAAEEYKKFEAQLKQTGKAGDEAGQQTAQGMNTAAQAAAQTGEVTVQSAQKAGLAYDLLGQQIDQAAGGYDLLGQKIQQTAGEYDLLGQKIQQTGDDANQAGQEAAQGINAINQKLLTGIQVIQQYQSALRQIAFLQNLDRPTSVRQGDRPNPIGPGFAEGGLLGGRGTGTSDSNLAWVSRGEYITPARAVGQPGVLAFLEALRRSGGNLRGVLDGLGRFALGGLVPRSAPAFAGGGPVGSMSHVTIQFPGVPPVAGLRASSAVVGELQKAAALAQVRSGGRKPSRYS